MATKLRALGAAVLTGLFASAACTSANPSAGGGGAQGTGQGGESGTATNNGGRGGTATAQGGSSGKSTGGATNKGGGAGTASGTGGEAGAGPQCPQCASGFCLADGTCVDCLPSDDHCPLAQYCTDANTCAPGCKTDGSNCASGVCLAGHDCKSCISDDECSAGQVCGAGQCAPACNAAQEGEQANCGTGLTCCSTHCASLETDSNHCGACGTTCGSSQFCGRSACSDTSAGAGGEGGADGAGTNACAACHDTTLANLCAINNIIVISDQDKNTTDGNLAPARAIASALNGHCEPAPPVTEELQNTPDALNITTGHPVSGGGTLLVVAGGPFFQNLEGYFEQSTSPLYFLEVNDTQEFVIRATGAIAVSRPADTDNLSHDFFIIQFMRDPSSGSLVLNAQGFWQSGTTAAALELQSGLIPTLATLDKTWYAYEWTDANNDKLPQLDEIVLQASGP